MKITKEDFDEILTELLKSMLADELLAIPGLYEILAEHLNNDILDEYIMRHDCGEEEEFEEGFEED